MDPEKPDESSSKQHAPSANIVLGYTRWNEEVIKVESAEECESIPLNSETPSLPTFGSSSPPGKIKISLSQSQISCKPPTKPSAIPKRTMPMRPSTVLNQSMLLQTKKTTAKNNCSTSDSDSYNEVFAEPIAIAKLSTKPKPKTKPSVSVVQSSDCRIPATEKISLLRKFSAPTIEATALSLPTIRNGSPKLGARLASNGRNTASAGALMNVSKSKLTSNQYLDDQHKCTICSNPFSDPRVLDCLHTFCFVCLCTLDAGGTRAASTGGTAGAGLLEETMILPDVDIGLANSRQRMNCDGSELDLSGKL